MDIGPGDRRNRRLPPPERGAGGRIPVVKFDGEIDIKAAIDQIDHGFLMKAVRSHIGEGWILLYVERWVTAPFETADGQRLARERGTPQGEVVSPILMNLFMRYAFDAWIQRTNPSCPFARYADDAVVRCRSREQAEDVIHSIALRLAECGLTMPPEKSKVAYCKDGKRTAVYPLCSATRFRGWPA